MFNFVRKVSVAGLIAQILLINVVVCLAETQTTAAAAATAVDHPPSASRQVLLIHHVQSRTSSITLSWASNSSYSSYQVRARSLLSGITLTGQPTNETEYTLTDLMIDTPYDVCVTAKATEASVTADSRSSDEGKAVEEDEEACLQIRTIPSVRVDSVLVLFGVISFIVLSVAAALVCWKCSQKNDAETAADATASDYKDDANDGVDGPGAPETDIRKNQDEAARPLLAIGKADKVKIQPEVEFVSGPAPQSSNNLQSNEVSAEQKSDGPTLV